MQPKAKPEDAPAAVVVAFFKTDGCTSCNSARQTRLIPLRPLKAPETCHQGYAYWLLLILQSHCANMQTYTSSCKVNLTSTMSLTMSLTYSGTSVCTLSLSGQPYANVCRSLVTAKQQNHITVSLGRGSACGPTLTTCCSLLMVVIGCVPVCIYCTSIFAPGHTRQLNTHQSI
jgi:hypothetical protein